MYNSLCSVVRRMQDLERVTATPKRLAYEEYMRVLSQHQLLTPRLSTYDSRVYRIDKVVRDRLKSGHRFGFDHSEVLRLELEGTEAFEGTEGKKLTDRLSAVTTRSQSRPLSYEDWKERKEAENRIKSKLLRSLHSSDQELQLTQLSLTQHKELQKTQQIAVWEETKRKEAAEKRSKSKLKAEKEEMERKERMEKGAKAYQEWLQGSLRKLQMQKIKDAERRIVKRQMDTIADAKAEAHKKAVEARYQEWLQSKLPQKKSISRVETPHYRSHLPIMLAYSPNRPKPVSSPSFVTSSQASNPADYIPEESDETPQSSLHDLPDPLDRNHQRIFDELSSIQRTSHFLGNAVESGEEEFPSQGDSMSSNLD